MSARITIRPVPEAERHLIDTMARRYFGEVLPDGPPYHAGALDRYWIEPGRHPYFIEADGTPIGFALVWNHEGGVHELVEFTILSEHRRRGIGSAATEMIFESLGGDWVLGVAREPPGAADFWRSALEEIDSVCDITEHPPRTPNQGVSFRFRVQR